MLCVKPCIIRCQMKSKARKRHAGYDDHTTSHLLGTSPLMYFLLAKNQPQALHITMNYRMALPTALAPLI